MKLFSIISACLIALTTQSCAQVKIAPVNVKKMTYKALRQHDCRTNEPTAFCERGFSNEFEEYERLREQFLRDELIEDELFANKQVSLGPLALPKGD